MNPKEKAEELIRKYIPHVTYYDMADSEPVDYSHLAIPVAKKCAIIAVNEVIEVIDDFEFSNHGKIGNNYGQKFWYEVVEEIENLEVFAFDI